MHCCHTDSIYSSTFTGYSIILLNLNKNTTVLWNKKSLPSQFHSSPAPFPKVVIVTSPSTDILQIDPSRDIVYIDKHGGCGRGHKVWVECVSVCMWVDVHVYICAQRRQKRQTDCLTVPIEIRYMPWDRSIPREWLQSCSLQGNSAPLL